MEQENWQLQILANEHSFELIREEKKLKSTQEETAETTELWNSYQNDPIGTFYSIGFMKYSKWHTPSFSFVLEICQFFFEELRKVPQLDELRDQVKLTIDAEQAAFLLLRKPYMLGEEYINEEYLLRFFDELLQYYHKEIKAYQGSVSQYFKEYLQKDPVGRVFFHLVENSGGDEPFAFLATYSQIQTNGATKQIPLIHALKEYREDTQTLVKLLSTVDKASTQSSFIKELSNSGELMHALKFNPEEAYSFLKEIPLYESCGIVCRVPKWFKQRVSRVGVSVSAGDEPSSMIGMDTLLDFHVNISVNGEILSREELEQLAAMEEGLAFIKGKWVEIKQGELDKILAAYKEVQEDLKDGLTLKEALRLQLQEQKSEEEAIISIEHGDWLKDVFGEMRKPSSAAAIELDIQADLRPYQSVGVNWLGYLQNLGFGACLADDMGLGKTLQVLAFLTARSNKDKKTLLVVPASLLTNWEDEIHHFAPQLKYVIVHSSNTRVKMEEALLDDYQIIITTYSMCSRYSWIMDHHWDILVLDEAQAIKNPNTKQTKTVKKIQADYRIALSGTPIENRLMDLWSLFDFLNCGLLATNKEFKALVKDLQKEENTQGYARLRAMTSPFILRRLKTDKTVVSDLPDKIEMKTYAKLSKKQIALYQDLVSNLKESLNKSEGIQRKGLVLSSLMKFKQICNHPDEYLGEQMFDYKESGKFLRLQEICEEIYEKHERVLIFTQFKEIIEPLSNFLESIFHGPGVTLHGGHSVKQRKEAVTRFQGDSYVPFMILSIKAGGVGLNLTKASHVVHFDRWWNPAIENQATDRAFRIGQKKNVIVHKFICEGTVEEKIDEMIEQKKSLSQDVIQDGNETWITEMNNEELLHLFDLKEGY